MSKAAQAITPAEADAALAGLAAFDCVVLAVSGGPDSLALLYLAAEWQRRSGPTAGRLSVATVDHRLRAESRGEAELVAAHASRLGLPHAILEWRGPKPATGLPDAARRARYQLLREHTQLLAGPAPAAVATAHHADDQAETLLMRLARGSGADGLAAMPAARAIEAGSTVTLLRPLLAFSKARLVASIEARSLSAVEDPTNTDMTFERARIRRLLPVLSEAGIEPDALALSARRLGAARAALDYAFSAFESTLGLDYNHEVFATLDRAAFEKGPSYLRQRVLERLIGRFGGDSAKPELSEIETLVARLGTRGSAAFTLGGALVSAGPASIRVWREAGRLSGEDVVLAPGCDVVWDARFRIRRTAEGGGALAVRPLGETAFRSLWHVVDHARLPAQAAAALPAVWSRDRLVAVPSLAPFAVGTAVALDPAGIEVRAVSGSDAASRPPA